MYPNTRLTPPTALSLVLCSLLFSGCASEKALLTQTQPLQERIDRVEQNLASSSEASLRAAKSQADSLATRQSELERHMHTAQAELARLREQLKAADARTLDALTRLQKNTQEDIKENIQAGLERHLKAQGASLNARLDGMEQQLSSLSEQVKNTAQRSAELNARQDQNVAASTGSVAEGLADAQRRIAEVSHRAQALSRENAERAAALQNRQEAAELANAALSKRLQLAEGKLSSLTDHVQEALALAAKEIFLANGREAFSVMLTDDKVLYPQNDPNLDSRDVAKLNQLALKLGKLDQEYHLDIQGHTANNSTEDNNYNLGKARAEVVKRYLHEQQNISINRMSTISYGASKPQTPESGANRRIYIRVLVLK